jgi:tRNA threonylcarbamoyladenosine biosynthesis protein TsaB
VKRLIIDTATRACSVALFDGDSCIASVYEEIGRGHAERLVPMIADLPDQGRADSIHVNVGPGSFTGIRVGVSAARALALAWGAECRGYGCLEMVAAMAADQHGPGVDFGVAMIGGHGELFIQLFDANGGNVNQPPMSLPVDQAVTRMANYGFIFGDAAEQIVTATGQGKALPILPDAKYWHLLNGKTPLPPAPYYVRGPDAKLPGGITP